ncbi:competence protein CoiA family protein [Nocardia miyunensis]|uniref:competence protein CoiA family protein n=1 Tax=Nocardia miyunensis TaxID=282684 RepID=UPI0008344B0B|nr:competence protein CoiA family protein [Nocardia miyunensis]
MRQLRAKGYLGDRTLVCALCYAGVGTASGAVVPVVVRGRIGGDRRPHFAHPPGLGPTGGLHAPESVWHLASKAVLTAWARKQPGVIEVRNEVWLPHGQRRCDVQVLFADGSQVALEAQSSRLSDSAWATRHHDYRSADVLDEWFWHADHPTPWMMLADTEHPRQIWILDPWRGVLTLLAGAPHPYTSGARALQYRVEHLPPCVRDDLIPYEVGLSQLTLTRDGIDIPAHLRRRLADQLEQERLRINAVVEDAARGTPPPLVRPSATPNPTEDLLGWITASWPAIRARTRQTGGAAVHALLTGASVCRIENDTLILSHEHEPLVRRLALPKYSDAVRCAVRQVLGRDYQIEWTVVPMPAHTYEEPWP